MLWKGRPREALIGGDRAAVIIKRQSMTRGARSRRRIPGSSFVAHGPDRPGMEFWPLGTSATVAGAATRGSAST